MRMLLPFAAGLSIAALAVPLLANSAPRRQTDAITILQQRVSNLERTTKHVQKQLAAQIKINGVQARTNSATSDRLQTLESKVANPPKPTFTVSSSVGTPVTIDYQNWGHPYALCPGGTTVIGGGYDTDAPIMVGGSRLGSSAPSWNFAVYNPYYQRTTVTPYAICLSLATP